jgi:hypothetical protein
MTPITVAQYNYYTRGGAGTGPNRRIDFKRQDSIPTSVFAEVYAITPEGDQLVSKLSGSQINVEMMTISDKLAALKLKQKGETVPTIPDQSLDTLSLEKQDMLFSTLEPKGRWKVEVSNQLYPVSTFEKVSKLSFFNPS